MATLAEDTIVREFLNLDNANRVREEAGEAQVAIMPSDLARTISVNEATVRAVLRKRGLWEQRHRDAAKKETLRRINEGKARNGYASLRRQQESGYSNLVKGRQRLAEIRRQQKSALAASSEQQHA